MTFSCDHNWAPVRGVSHIHACQRIENNWQIMAETALSLEASGGRSILPISDSTQKENGVNHCILAKFYRRKHELTTKPNFLLCFFDARSSVYYYDYHTHTHTQCKKEQVWDFVGFLLFLINILSVDAQWEGHLV